MPKTTTVTYEKDEDGVLVCVVCGWERDDCEDGTDDHEEHHRWLEYLAR